MLKNDQELQVTLERIRYFQQQVRTLRAVETNPANYRLSVSGYLVELDRMNLEVRDYLWLHPEELTAAGFLEPIREASDEPCEGRSIGENPDSRKVMAKNKTSVQRDPLPENFTTLEAFWEFWDTHSSAEYEDLMEPVEADIDLTSAKVYCPIAKDVMPHVRTRAHAQGVSTETLVNLWLQEKVAPSA